MTTALALEQMPVSEAQLVASLCLESFEDFVHEFWNDVPGYTSLQWNWHMSTLCQALQEAAERVFLGHTKSHDLAINVPPGSSKSTLCSILFPAWIWTRMPKARFICASHTASLTHDLAYKSRTVLLSDKYRECFFDVKIKDDKSAISDFSNVAGGERKAATVGGVSPTGRHAHFLIVDDPIDPNKAVSELELKTAEEFMTHTLPSRKMRPLDVSVTILVMQRLHVGDPTAGMLKSAKVGGGKVLHICIPAELTDKINPPELAKYYVNGLMDSERFTAKFLAEQRAKSLYAFNAQYLQSPDTAGGAMFRPGYFAKRVKASPWQAKARWLYIDLAATAGSGCRTAMVLMSCDENNLVYVEECRAGHWDVEERDAEILRFAQDCRSRYGPSQEPTIYVEIEPGASGISVVQYLSRLMAGFKVVGDQPTGKKTHRWEGWASYLAAGNVRIVDNGAQQGTGQEEWDVEGYVREHCEARIDPAGKPIGLVDCIDSSAGGYNRVMGRAVLQAPRFYHFGKKLTGPTLRIIVCDKDELDSLQLVEQTSLLIRLVDPPTPDNQLTVDEKAKEALNRYGLQKMLAKLELQFADLNPEERQDTWNEPIQPWNKVAKDLVFQKRDGIRLWTFINRWIKEVECLILASAKGNRALTLALMACDCLGLKRSETIWKPSKGDEKGYDKETKFPNPWLAEMVKTTRNLVT